MNMPRRPKIERVKLLDVFGLGKYVTFYRRERIGNESRYMSAGNPYDTSWKDFFKNIRKK